MVIIMVTHSYGKLSERKKVKLWKQSEIYKETTKIALLLEQIASTA